MGLGMVSAPSPRQWVIDRDQCQSTTTAMLAARRKSTTLSRVAGVASTNASRSRRSARGSWSPVTAPWCTFLRGRPSRRGPGTVTLGLGSCGTRCSAEQTTGRDHPVTPATATPTLERRDDVFVLHLGDGENRFHPDWIAAIDDA